MQRDSYLIEIEHLQQHIHRLEMQYKDLSEQENMQQTKYEESLKGY